MQVNCKRVLCAQLTLFTIQGGSDKWYTSFLNDLLERTRTGTDLSVFRRFQVNLRGNSFHQIRENRFIWEVHWWFRYFSEPEGGIVKYL